MRKKVEIQSNFVFFHIFNSRLFYNSVTPLLQIFVTSVHKQLCWFSTAKLLNSIGNNRLARIGLVKPTQIFLAYGLLEKLQGA